MSTQEARLAAEDIEGWMPDAANQEDINHDSQSDLITNLATGKLAGKVALMTGGDGSIGRVVEFAFATEGDEVVITYNQNDAALTEKASEEKDGGQCLVEATGEPL